MLRYYFDYVVECEMCGDTTQNHKILGQRLNTTQGLKPKSKIGISTTVLKCNSCGLVYANPKPIPFDIADHYGIPPESYWRTHIGYFTWTPEYFAHEISLLKKLMPPVSNPKALDIGAGLGKCMISLERAGFDAYGFEPSQPFYERALSQMKINPEKLKLGMVESVDYEKEYFDFISFGAVFEHLYNPSKSLEKALSWLKPGGIIHIEVPSAKYLIQRIINLYYKVLGTTYISHISPMHPPYHLFEFELSCFNQLAKRLNYKVVHHEQLVGTISNFPTATHKILKKIMHNTNTGMQLIVWLKKND